MHRWLFNKLEICNNAALICKGDKVARRVRVGWRRGKKAERQSGASNCPGQSGHAKTAASQARTDEFSKQKKAIKKAGAYDTITILARQAASNHPKWFQGVGAARQTYWGYMVK